MSSRFEVQVDERGTRLAADNNQCRPPRAPDRQRARLIDELLITAKPAPDIAWEHIGGVVFLADGAGKGDVAVGERHSDGDTDPDVGVEQAQHQAEGEDHDGACTAVASWTPWSPPGTAPLMAHFR